MDIIYFLPIYENIFFFFLKSKLAQLCWEIKLMQSGGLLSWEFGFLNYIHKLDDKVIELTLFSAGCSVDRGLSSNDSEGGTSSSSEFLSKWS